MTDIFTCQYLVSQLSQDSDVTAKQLHLISQGRRTASVLFNIEKNRLFAVYSLFQNWTIEDWKNMVHSLKERKWITLKEETIQLTETGLMIKSEFNEKYPYLTQITSLEYAKTKWDVWARFIFVNQIVSEYRHGNSRYNPYLKTLVEQRQIKKWIKKHGPSLKDFSDQWMKEVFHYVHLLTDKQATICTDLLVGHQQPGLTKRQLIEKYEITGNQLTILLLHMIENLKDYALKQSPLLWDLFQIVHKENDYGLSNSTFHTMLMLENGKSINHISQIRNLKANTIKDHILEMVIVKHWNAYKSFIPLEEYGEIHKLFNQHPNLTFSEAKAYRHNIEFFWFRLIEIERMRQHD